jgi:hypothetical protein
MTSDAQTATLTNPLADGAPADPEDAVLVARAHSGDRASLEELVRRHQRWIYNIAIRKNGPSRVRRGDLLSGGVCPR